jgi:hypothetical protein
MDVYQNPERHWLIKHRNLCLAFIENIRNQNIPIDLQLKYVDAMAEPILLYGSEIWGYENIKIIEQVHLGFCKRILKVRSSTPNVMVHGELGRYPLKIRVKIRMI